MDKMVCPKVRALRHNFVVLYHIYHGHIFNSSQPESGEIYLCPFKMNVIFFLIKSTINRNPARYFFLFYSGSSLREEIENKPRG